MVPIGGSILKNSLSTQDSSGWIRGLTPFLKRRKNLAIVAFLSAIVGLTINSLVPLLQRDILDQLQFTHRVSNLSFLIVLLIGAGLLSFGFSFLRRYVGGKFALDVQNDLRNEIFAHLQRLDFARHDELETGQLVSRANSDAGLIQGILAFLPLMTGNLLSLVISVVIMLILSPLLTVITLVAVPIMAIITFKLRDSVFPASYLSQQKVGEVAQIVEDTINGIRVVKSFGAEARMKALLETSATELFKSRVRVVRLSAKLQSLLQAVPSYAQVGILALGGYMAINNQISIGTFLAFSTYVTQLIAPVRMLSALVAFSQQARAGAERILALLASTPTVLEKEDAIELANVKGEIVLDNVNFGYLASNPVLKGISIKMIPGKKYAFVGPSGCGKSTLALLIPRFYDVNSGSISIDGINIKNLSIRSLRKSIGIVFEETFLFSESVRYNIAIGKPDATDDEVQMAAKAAGAHDFIVGLKQGYDTIVGERGLTLSGGQRQRIALARALIGDPKILILDDATSAIDAKTEESIHDTIREISANKTVILIAHRRSTLNLADEIILLNSGCIVDQGTEAELFKRNSFFRALLAGGENLDRDQIAIEAEIRHQQYLDSVQTGELTIEAWPENYKSVKYFSASDLRQSGLGVGLGGGGSLAGLLAPTPELLKKINALKPIYVDPKIDMKYQSERSPHFSLTSFLRPFYVPLILAFTLILFDTLLSVAGPFFVKSGVDKGVLTHHLNILWFATIVFLLTTSLDVLDSFALLRIAGKTVERILLALRVKIFSQLLRLGMNYYERELAGRIMTRMTTDVDAVSQLMQTGFTSAASNVLTFIAIGCALFLINYKLALACFAVIPVLAVGTWKFRNMSRAAYELAREKIASVNANLQEGISGIRVSQAFSLQDESITQFADKASEYLNVRIYAQKLVAFYFSAVLFCADLSTAILLGYGSRLVALGSVSLGSLIAFNLLLTQFFSPIQQLSQTFDYWQQAQVSFGRVKELMNEVPTPDMSSGHMILNGPTKSLKYQNCSFAYSGSHELVLKEFNYTIPQGKTIAIVGPTGAGKSTILKLGVRFYDPLAGSVTLNDVNMVDIANTSFRKVVGYVPQEPFLFSMSIRDNIAFGNPEASNAEIEAVSRLAGLHEFVTCLDGGYYHIVKEGGKNLSSGEKQLIALARAELANPQLLFLDEATANLDLRQEALVNATLKILASKRTAVIVAHRLQTAAEADEILVIVNGKLSERGTHGELLAKGKLYAKMWQSFDIESAIA